MCSRATAMLALRLPPPMSRLTGGPMRRLNSRSSAARLRPKVAPALPSWFTVKAGLILTRRGQPLCERAPTALRGTTAPNKTSHSRQ